MIMIGGAPVTQDCADKIGADGYAADAASAVDIAKNPRRIVQYKLDHRQGQVRTILYLNNCPANSLR
jgi:hypothetical protein